MLGKDELSTWQFILCNLGKKSFRGEERRIKTPNVRGVRGDDCRLPRIGHLHQVTSFQFVLRASYTSQQVHVCGGIKMSVENKRDVLAHRAESKLMIIQYTSEVCDILVQWVSAIQKVIIIRHQCSRVTYP
jgi:hypothetical protein